MVSQHEPLLTPVPPTTLWRYLGEKNVPTDQQAAVVGAQPGPLLVVAGAGAGKTETMASRVVWLVANGYVRPEEVLGLTFTRKAAQELGKRIRTRLEKLAANEQLVRRLDPTGALADSLTAIAPTVSTYDSYAGSLVREYGLLVPVEPDARIITEAELHAIAREVVLNHSGALLGEVDANPTVNNVVENLLKLVNNMGNELYPPERVRDEAKAFIDNIESIPPGPKQGAEKNQTVERWITSQRLRTAYVDLAVELSEELRRRGVATFNEQMTVAAQLAREHALVGASQRDRFRVVMLDEYQDTSHSQRVLLRSLFGENRDDSSRHSHPLTVTAVGDPMQSIYGWRGATAANLAAFVDDFPQADGSPAPKAQLTMSWRNPPEVLALANSVSSAVLGDATEGRAVEPLVPSPYTGDGRVELGYYATEDEEIAAVADALASEYQECIDAGEPVDIAALVRSNKHSPLIANALEERGVPCEIVGLSGLLTVPEVADAVAVARMLVHPHDSAAALRILSGPACGLGLKDIAALSQRATNLAGGRQRSSDADAVNSDTDPRERLQIQLAELIDAAENSVGYNERNVGLADAIADLGEPERYSDEGFHRLQVLSGKLRALRTRSLGKQLPDVFDDIVSVFGIRTEVLARHSRTGTVHLDKFAEIVASYPGADVEGFLGYLDLAQEHEDGLQPGSLAAREDCVQILTAHKAKGLEWDTVAVVHADSSTYKGRAETFISAVHVVPDDAYDVFDAAENRAEFQALTGDYTKRKTAEQEEEASRIFYVALTRAAKRLIVTGSGAVAGRAKVAEPYKLFAPFRDVTLDDSEVPAARIMHWWDGTNAEEIAVESGREGVWPGYSADPASTAAAELVSAAKAALPPAAAGELFGLWEQDANLLIAEHTAAMTPSVAVDMPAELTASDIVAMRADAEQFARRARRPVPFKPNSYAKRGTAFHEWVESFYGARPLLGEDELPGNDEENMDAQTLAQLKASFEASPWAGRTPAHIEHPFEIDLGTSTVRGRIDAVFWDPEGAPGHERGGWTIVDWKTGAKPNAADMRAAKLQLAVYREAWRRIAGDGEDIRAVFFYVRTGENFAPTDLPERADLEELLRTAADYGLESPM